MSCSIVTECNFGWGLLMKCLVLSVVVYLAVVRIVKEQPAGMHVWACRAVAIR